MFRIEDLILREVQPLKDIVYVTENDSFDGYSISEYKKIIWASLDLKMPKITNYISIVNKAREQVYKQIVENAKSIGANAIINFKFSTIINADNIEISVTGNAVKIEPIFNFIPSGDVAMMIEKVLHTYMKNEKERVKHSKDASFGLI